MCIIGRFLCIKSNVEDDSKINEERNECQNERLKNESKNIIIKFLINTLKVMNQKTYFFYTYCVYVKVNTAIRLEVIFGTKQIISQNPNINN